MHCDSLFIGFYSHSQTLFLHKQGKCDFAVCIRSQFPLQRRQLAALPKHHFHMTISCTPWREFLHSLFSISQSISFRISIASIFCISLRCDRILYIHFTIISFPYIFFLTFRSSYDVCYPSIK